MLLNFKKSLPYLGGFLGAVLLATAAFVGGYWYRGIVVDQPQPKGEAPTSPSPSPEMEAQVINLDHGLDMSDWVTSRSENLGLTVKHPKDWYGMDYVAQSGGGGRTPSFGLTFPIKVDLNYYQQITAEGEKFRLDIFNVSELRSIEEAQKILEEDAVFLTTKLSKTYTRVERRSFEEVDFKGILNYIYTTQGNLEFVDGYLIYPSSTYRVIFSSSGEDEINPNYLATLEQIVSTLKLGGN